MKKRARFVPPSGLKENLDKPIPKESPNQNTLTLKTQAANERHKKRD